MNAVSSTSTGTIVGLASRKAATAALKAHVAVIKGTPMRRAISEALAGGGNLGGKERRFVAFAARELSRHLRRVNLGASQRGMPMAKLHLPEDQAIFRYALWRVDVCGAGVDKVMTEIGLPGPLRPRGIPDQLIRAELEKPFVPDFGAEPLERAANEHSFPGWLAERISQVAPAGELAEVLAALNREPAIVARVRPPGTRDEVLAALRAQDLAVEASTHADAIEVSDESRAIFETRWMKEGRLQVMDVGSQLLVDLCQIRPDEICVDYCAGAGGKTLALADAVGPRGRVYAWDENPKRLNEAKRRVGELQLRHVSFPLEPRLDLADVVLVDAPCSGSGTLGREPDQKWKLTKERVSELAGIQASILRTIAPRLRSGARLIYGTCSLLREEDEAVVEAFVAAHPAFRLEASLRVWPHRSSGGGFYGARLIKS